MKRGAQIIEKIYRDIKEIKIQGATNVAKAAVEAYSIDPRNLTIKKLISLRPTEPMLVNSLHFLKEWPKEKVLDHFTQAQDKINNEVFEILNGKKSVYTHCHSTNVVKALIYSKKMGRKFEVYNTETRPLFQGRITSKELANAGLKVTQFVDSGMHEAIQKADLVLLGSDAILKSGAINKIGSAAIAEIAKIHKKPVYIVADSWKFSRENVKIEERDFHEVWKDAPKNIKVRDPAFERIDKKYIKKIISELGILNYEQFLKKTKSN